MAQRRPRAAVSFWELPTIAVAILGLGLHTFWLRQAYSAVQWIVRYEEASRAQNDVDAQLAAAAAQHYLSRIPRLVRRLYVAHALTPPALRDAP
jgi:hypothetical protein